VTREVIALGLLCAAALASAARAADVCDRTCLTGLVDRYITAMVAHDPERLPLAQGVKFTEDGQELRLGDGLWATASAPGRYKLYVSDPEDGQVGAQQKSGFYPFVTSIRNRRFPVVDRERGLVLSFAFFEHSGALKTIHLTNGMTIPSPVEAPLTLEISELFQIHGGKIDQVEAVINTVPYGMKSAVWDAPRAPEAADGNLAGARP